MGSDAFLILLGALLVVAFLAEEAFRWQRLPPVLVLMTCGLLLGPVTHALPVEDFTRVAPHFGALAFLLILFEGGLDLDLKAVVGGFAPGARLALYNFVAALIVATAIALASGLPWLSALVLGLVLAPISGAIVLPLSGRLGLRPELRALVVLEGALADVFGVLGLELVARWLTGGGLAGLLAIGSLLAAAFSVILALVAGLLWPRVLRALGERRYIDVLTFGIALAMWGFVEFLGASGVLVVLCFGLTLANEREILAVIGLDPSPVAEMASDVVTRLHAFIVQLTFLVRAFFFVLLGVVVQFTALAGRRYLEALAVLGLFAAVRFAVLKVLERRGRIALAPSERRLVWYLQPRGLVSAVLAIEAVHLGVAGAGAFLAMASLVIIGSNVVMAVGLRAFPIGATMAGIGKQPTRE
ncbi:MAG: cation:proton antiporter [Acidobacteriota bacterium]